MNCYSIVYTSDTTVSLAEPALQLLLRQARAEHEQAGITGVLLYSDERFLQVLEGEEQKVRAFFARIATDPRHYKLQVLADGPKPECDFSDWSMAFACSSPATCGQLPNYRSLTELLELSRPTSVYHLLRDFLSEGTVPVL